MFICSNPSIYAVCNETSGMYPFGTRAWYFFNDTCTKEDKPNQQSIASHNHPSNPKETEKQVQISFSSCSEDSEFNCHDGAW